MLNSRAISITVTSGIGCLSGQHHPMPIVALVAVEQSLDRRRSRTEHERRAALAHHPRRHIARIVARARNCL